MKTVECTWTALGTNHTTIRYGLRKCLDDVVHGITCTIEFLTQKLASDERYISGIEMKVVQQVIIYFIDLCWPLLVTCIGAALMEEDTFDDSLMGSTKSAFKHT